MSVAAVAPATLRQWLRTGSPGGSLAVIDVRDSDHVGGHIRGSVHVPAADFAGRVPELKRQLQHTADIVFHCALSQVRGPRLALRFSRETGRDVWVLEGGFSRWLQLYGNDPEATEDYSPDLWE